MKLQKIVTLEFVSETRRKGSKIVNAVTCYLFYGTLHTEAGDGGRVVVDRHIVVAAAGALLQAEGQPAQPQDATWSSSYNPPAQTSNFLILLWDYILSGPWKKLICCENIQKLKISCQTPFQD
jgi:hypothetical protein